ncbi:ABC transporter ATP-binding protein [Rugamonas sp. DEMB1]|nr:ABC transporter ATP-binding protein [Rugamonas sp. DEMB1]WGG49444.1 ABC transporter ATP-binding protein [Rugamonas sp. DEMB1]
MDHLLDVRDLRVRFRIDKHSSVEALKGVSFVVPRNSTVALVGESGSGKSVSSLAVMGLLPAGQALLDPASQILFAGQDLLALAPAARRRVCGKDIAMIFQEPMSSLNPVFSVGFQIGEVLRLHMGMNRAQARLRTLALLDEVGIPDPARKIDAYPNQLSGGQQQRVMIAMAIACAPQLLIADEPTTALDVTIQKQIIDLLARLQRERQMSVLFITHDLGLVGEIADSVVVMRHGEVREAGPVRQIFDRPQDAYTRALLHCRPPLDARPRRLPVIADYMNGELDGKPGGALGAAGRPGPGPGPAAAPALAGLRDAAPALAAWPAPAPAPDRVRGYLPGDDKVLVVENLSKSFFVREGWFGQREFQAVKNVSFTLARGKTLGVVGESGCGKTTVGLTLLRLHQASGGSAMFEGKGCWPCRRASTRPTSGASRSFSRTPTPP